MTVKEFSDKYKIPYSIVYKASYVAEKINDYDCSYYEKDLLNCVNNVLTERINRATEQLKNAIALKHKLTKRSLRSD